MLANKVVGSTFIHVCRLAIYSNELNHVHVYSTRNAHAHVMPRAMYEVFDACAPNCDRYLRKLP